MPEVTQLVPRKQKTLNDCIASIYRARVEQDAGTLFLITEMESLAKAHSEKCAECEELKRKYEPEEKKKDA